MKYVNIDKLNLKFKNLVLAPAPLGRMLKYLLYVNKKVYVNVTKGG